MYKIEKISIVDVMEIFFMSYIKVSKKAYSFYTHDILFGGRHNREAFKITLDAVEYSKLFDLSIKKEYKAHEFYMVHIRDIVNWKVFENKYYAKKQNSLFGDIVFIYINKELDISYLEIYVLSKSFINKLNSMFFIAQTSWIRKQNLTKRERNYLFRLNTLKAFNNGYDQFADRRTQNNIIADIKEVNSLIEFAEDIKFLTGESEELEKTEERKQELIREWDNLVWTDKQYQAPIKRYKLNKKPKTYTKKVTGKNLKYDEYGMLI